MRHKTERDRIREAEAGAGFVRHLESHRLSVIFCADQSPELWEVTCPPELTDQKPCISSQKGVAEGVNEIVNMGFTESGLCQVC